MVKITPLYSGSKGNAVLVDIDGYLLLLDAGKTFSKMSKALAELGKDPADIKDVMISHCVHTDHVHAIPKLCKANPLIRIWAETKPAGCPAGNHYEIGDGDYLGIVQRCNITPFRLDHDDPCLGFAVEAQGHRIVYITDTGSIPCESLRAMIDPTVLIVECNHDADTLINDCPYPDHLKERVIDTHFSVDQTCNLIELLAWPGLENVVLWHLSGNSINRELAIDQAQRVVNNAVLGQVKVVAAEQDEVGATIVLM